MTSIGITGGTGLVGGYVTRLLAERNYKVVILTRNATGRTATGNITYALWNAATGKCDANAMAGLDAVIHLAGEPVSGKRWTAAQKKKIRSSRVEGTRALIEALQAYAPGCKTVIAASATGFYGADRESGSPFTEKAAPAAGFLAETCAMWEHEELKAQAFARVAILRIGIVLARGGGAYREFVRTAGMRMLPVPGDGRQIVPWIHIADVASLIVYALENTDMRGIYNAVSPQPVSCEVLMKEIAKAHGGFFLRPHVPAAMLHMAVGELAGEVLKSCNVSALHTLDSGFKYKYPAITDATMQLASGI